MLAGAVLAALVLVAGLTPRASRRGALVLAALSLVWLLVNKPMEGPTLVALTRGHGLTAGDLAGCVGLVLAAQRWCGPSRSWGQSRGVKRKLFR